MNWWRLKNNQCPQCAARRNLEVNTAIQQAFCPFCNYSISFQRMGEIVRSLEHRKGEDIDKEMEPEQDPHYYDMEL